MDCQAQLTNLLGSTNISFPQITDFIPEFTDGIGILPRGSPFSVYVHHHSQEASKLIDALLTYDNFVDFLTAALYFCPRVNEMLYIFALSVASIHRNDALGIRVPPLYEIFPDQFVDERYLQAGTEKILQSQGSNYKTRMRRQLPVSASRVKTIIVDKMFPDGADPMEQQLAYFREDIGINSHHWHWHLIYPHSWRPRLKGGIIKDRRGELFYYVHQQMVRRYNAERLSHGMPLVTPLNNWDVPIKEEYNPHLFSSVTKQYYGKRTANSRLQDIDHYDAGVITVKNLTTWLDRIKDAMTEGFIILKNGSQLKLTEENGIDILATVIESNAQSPNLDYYGDLHNSGHVMISLMHDPKGKKKQEYGVMGFSETSSRDPAFYRWHQFMDDLFEVYKDTLKSYTDKDLDWKDVRINSIIVSSNRHEEKNKLFTYFQKRSIEISRGEDFQSANTSVTAKIKHLQYEKFKYQFSVENLLTKTIEATVRIFLAPKYNNNRKPFTPLELRRLFFELDRFRIKLNPGNNSFTRPSENSSVTISPSRTWETIQFDPVKFDEFHDEENYCGCGWPDHALIPKGKFEGMDFILFVMLTNWKHDQVNKVTGSKKCRDAVSLCGILNEKYPDKKPLGFPFDRKYSGSPNNYLRKQNMFMQDITVFHI